MPLDVRGRTRATMKASTCVLAPPERVGETADPPSCQGSGLAILARERGIPSKRESPARVIKSLPFVHTARRYYRLEGLVRRPDCCPGTLGTAAVAGRREEC